jgi:hypothetical protein
MAGQLRQFEKRDCKEFVPEESWHETEQAI